MRATEVSGAGILELLIAIQGHAAIGNIAIVVNGSHVGGRQGLGRVYGVPLLRRRELADPSEQLTQHAFVARTVRLAKLGHPGMVVVDPNRCIPGDGGRLLGNDLKNRNKASVNSYLNWSSPSQVRGGGGKRGKGAEDTKTHNSQHRQRNLLIETSNLNSMTLLLAQLKEC